jgi:hypothetical protein
MGGGGKGSTQTTQKMEIPPEVLARYNAVNARAEKVAQQPYQAYSNDPNAFVAPLTATQQAGIQNTNYMAGAAQPFYQAGAGLTAAGAQSVNPEALNVGQFYNPYTQSVADTTLRALQQQQGIERSSLVNPQTARSFGGDRSGIVAANLARQQDLATAQAMAPIFQKGFADSLAAAQQQQGVGLAAQQANANRALQAGGQFGQLGTGAQQAGLAGAQAQLAAGQTEQQTQQAGLQALYNQFQQQQAYPFQLTQFLSNIATGTGALSGNTTSGTQTGGGGFFSDERLKENIQKVGKTNDGQNIYRYNYKGDPRTQIGLLAQEVAQDHPDAVGKRDGYLTVDYRDATNDAVRDHKAAGGPEVGMDAYNINAPSAMLSPQVAGLGAIQLPQMIGGGGLPIQAGAINPAAQGLLAPKATGYSLGSKEGAQAELASLRGADMGQSQSGQEYFDYKTKALDDFLKNYDSSSQGGLVSGPGAFARGGYAEAGYVNPALAYYGPKGGQAGLGSGGPYGAALTPAQVQMLKAAELRFPQQKNGIEQANQIANLTSKGNELYQAWKKPAETTTTKETTPKAASSTGYTKPAQTSAAAPAPAPAPEPKGLVPGPNINVGANEAIDPEAMKAFDPSMFATDFAARGGLIVRQHHNTQGYVNAGASPYGNPEDENNTLGNTLSAPLEKHEVMQPGKLAQPQQGPSGAQQASQALGLAKAGKNAFDFGSKMLGSLGGEGAAAATGAAEAGLAGAAGAAEGASLLGTLGTAAGTIGEGIMAVLPFIGLSDERAKTDIEQIGKLNDGQPVYRFKYKGDDKTRMGLIAQDVERDHPEAVKGLGGVKMVDYKKATNDAVRQHHADGERVMPEEKKEDPSFLSSVGDAASSVAGGLGKVATGVGDTLKSKDETFWVPAIAGLGSMLASRNPTLFGAIGEGLVGGTGAYTNMQKMAAEQLAKRLELSKGRFKGPSFIDGKDMYQDTIQGDWVDEAEMGRRQSQFIAPGTTAAKALPAPAAAATSAAPVVKPDADVIDTAKKVITDTAPKIEPRPAQTVTPPVAPTVAEKKEDVVTPPAAPAEADGARIPTKAELIKAARANPTLFDYLPEERRPMSLEAEAARLEGEAKDYLRQSQEEARRSGLTKGPEERSRLEASSKKFADLAKDRRAEAAQKRVDANTEIENAISIQVEEAKSRTAKNVEREFAPEIGPTGEKVLLPPGVKMPPASVPKMTPDQEAAPKVATVDPKTGQLVLARPAAPAGGGIIQPGNYPPGTKVSEGSSLAKNQAEDDAKFLEDFRTKGYGVTQAREHYHSLINAFKMFESGSGEGKLAGLGAIMQSFGYTELAQKVASGDPAAVQQAEKIAPDLVLQTLKAANPRFAQAEFTVVNDKGVPEPNKLPEVNFKMIKSGLAYLNRTEAFALAWQRASQEEGWRSPSAYYAAWSKANPIAKFEEAADRQMGNFRGMDLPPANKWTPGTIYVVPKNLSTKKDERTGISQAEGFARMGLKPGDPFMYNGPEAKQTITRVDPKTLFSTPAMGQ